MIKIAVYRQKDTQEILRIHDIPKDKYNDVDAAALDYNGAEHDDEVQIVELKDNSLELYLYNQSKLDITKYLDEILSMQDDLHDLNDNIDWLCRKAKKEE